MEEEWRPVVELESRYEVSNLGRVRNAVTGRVLKPVLVNGYHRITPYIYGTKHRKAIHRLVATAFIPNPDNKPHINHIDNVRSNNIVTNLEWCTPKENSEHMMKQGRNVYYAGELSGQGRKTHCKNGHEFTPENTYQFNKERPQRICKTCRAAWVKKQHEKEAELKKLIERKVLEGRIDELLEIGLIAHKHEGESPVVWQIADEIDRRRESLTKTREGK